MKIPFLLSFCWLTLSFFSGRPVHAEPPATPCVQAEELVRRGLKLRLNHQDQEALDLVIRAERLCSSSRIVAQRGLAEQALGQWLEAEAHVDQALSAKDDPWIAKHRHELEEAYLAIGDHLGQLQVELETPGAKEAELLVDGERIATLPLSAPLPLRAGSVIVAVQAPGHAPVSRPVVIPARGLARERFVLVPLLAPRPEVAAPQPVVVEKAPKRTVGTWRVLGGVGVALGGLALGMGVAGHVVREQNSRAWNADVACVTAPLDVEAPPLCQTRLERVALGQRLALAGYIGGGVLAAGGVVLLALPARWLPQLGKEKQRVVLVPHLGSTLGLVVSGLF